MSQSLSEPTANYQITRARLRDAIDANCCALDTSYEDRVKLRNAASTMTRFASGSAHVRGIACPGAQAGLKYPSIWGCRFDDVLAELTGNTRDFLIYEVVDE